MTGRSWSVIQCEETMLMPDGLSAESRLALVPGLAMQVRRRSLWQGSIAN